MCRSHLIATIGYTLSCASLGVPGGTPDRGGCPSDDVEERFARMIDQRFAQMASDIKSVREADEPAPEPAPESFSMQLARRTIVRIA